MLQRIIQKLFAIWDPDFTKATLLERWQMHKSVKETEHGVYYSDKDVWD